MESILISIKKLLGITAEYDHFDNDLIIHINSVLNILTQLGVGPAEGYSITDEWAYWTDFIPNDPSLELIKTYVSLKVRLIFDPPTSSSAMEAMKQMISELEFRIQVTVDPSKES